MAPARPVHREGRLDDFNLPEREKQEVLAAFAGGKGEVSAGSPSGGCQLAPLGLRRP
jgi:hypothetical protein